MWMVWVCPCTPVGPSPWPSGVDASPELHVVLFLKKNTNEHDNQLIFVISCSRFPLIESQLLMNYIRAHTSTDTRRKKGVGFVKDQKKSWYILLFPNIIVFTLIIHYILYILWYPRLYICGWLTVVSCWQSIWRGGKSIEIPNNPQLKQHRTFHFQNVMFGLKQIWTMRDTCMDLVLRGSWWSNVLDIHFPPRGSPSSTTMTLEKWHNGWMRVCTRLLKKHERRCVKRSRQT